MYIDPCYSTLQVEKLVTPHRIIFFFLNCFWWIRSPYCLYSPLLPLIGQPTVKYHPRWQPIWGLAVHCRLGKLLDSNPGLQFYNLASPPMSHHWILIPDDQKTSQIKPMILLQNVPRQNDPIQNAPAPKCPTPKPQNIPATKRCQLK